MNGCLRVVTLVVLAALVTSCSKQERFHKATFPVTGEVYVDGKPAGNLQVTLHDVKGIDAKHPTHSAAMTDDNGKFAVSTYAQSDGVPEGEYAMTFVWGELNLLTMHYGGKDKLKNKYADPKTSKTRLTVEKGKPADMGRIELSTK